jgi:hypothetical protein
MNSFFVPGLRYSSYDGRLEVVRIDIFCTKSYNCLSKILLLISANNFLKISFDVRNELKVNQSSSVYRFFNYISSESFKMKGILHYFAFTSMAKPNTGMEMSDEMEDFRGGW